MSKESRFIGFAIFVFSIVVLVTGIILANTLKSINVSIKSESEKDKEQAVFDLSQVANYMNMTEEQVMTIINVEENELKTTGSFYGKMFPYFKIDDNFFFVKEEIDQWLREASAERRKYDSNNKIILH